MQDAKRPNDRLGLVTAAKDAYVSALPTRLNTQLVRQHTGALDGTDLAQAVRLALALNPDGAAMRLLLASDGNETTGGLLLAAENARAMGVPIDVMPIQFRYDREVMVDKVVARRPRARARTSRSAWCSRPSARRGAGWC